MTIKCFLDYYLNPSQINIKPKHYYFGLVGLDQKQCTKEPLLIDYFYNSSLSKSKLEKFSKSIINAFKIIFSDHDVLFAAFQEGIFVLIILRALGIYRKPIVIWQHRPIKFSSNNLKNLFIKFFYKGCDKLFFFSQKHIDDALNKNLIDPHKLILIDFGGDIDYFDRIKHAMPNKGKRNDHFITFGSENRDYKTIIEAFEKTINILDIYTSHKHGDNDYHKLLEKTINKHSNINIHFTKDLESIFPTLFELSLNSFCVVISVLEKNYTVGLTQLIDSIAMGLPIITTDNPYYPFDVEKEGIGLKIKYGSVDEWVTATNYLSSHPEIAKEMGRKARLLAENRYNCDIMIKQIIGQLTQVTTSI